MNMLTVENLIGLEFNGSFRRRMNRVLSFMDQRDKIKLEDSEYLAKFNEEHGCSDTEDAIENMRFDFQMWILKFDSIDGIFIAEAKDYWGVSGIVGNINGNDINFNKFYMVKMGGKFQGMREINYSGNISFYEREITAQGKYEISGTSSNFDGTWDMKSVSK